MANVITRHIPNTLTCCNLFSGCVACTMAFHNRYELALTFIIIGAIFDFFDGFAARLLHAPSPIGKDLDSLADDISFGIAPAVIVYSLLKELEYPLFMSSIAEYVPYFAFLIAVFSALRLAKFNIDTRQTSSFIGMPTPANALFWASLIAGQHDYIKSCGSYMLFIILWMVILTCWLLVAEIPMFSLKVKNFTWKDNKIKYILIAISIALLLSIGFSSIAAIITIYVLLALFTGKKN